MTELNNKQQQKERGIQRNRRGPGDAFADEAGSELVGYRKAVPDGRSCRGEGSYNNSSGAAGDGDGVEAVEEQGGERGIMCGRGRLEIIGKGCIPPIPCVA